MRVHVLEPLLGEEEKTNVIECIDKNHISKGDFINLFERLISEYVGTKYAVSTNSGTSALHLALIVNGIKDCDVIIPDMTFASTMFAIKYCNSKPITVDIDNDYWCIDIENLSKNITSKTKAIVAVDLFGHPCCYEPLERICEEYDLKLILDSCESLGSEYIKNDKKHIKSGSIGSAGCFSFYGNKIITCGEGGALVTNDKDVYNKAIHYRNGCMLYPYLHDDIGYNYRLDNLRASILCSQMKKLPYYVKTKRKINETYRKSFKYNTNIVFQAEQYWAVSNYWLTCVIVNSHLPIDDIRSTMLQSGIETRPFFTPVSMMFKDGNNPISYEVFKKGICLPSGVRMSEDKIAYVASVLSDIVGD